MWEFINRPRPNLNDDLAAVEAGACTSSDMPMFYVALIIHPCPNANNDLGSICQ